MLIKPRFFRNETSNVEVSIRKNQGFIDIYLKSNFKSASQLSRPSLCHSDHTVFFYLSDTCCGTILRAFGTSRRISNVGCHKLLFKIRQTWYTCIPESKKIRRSGFGSNTNISRKSESTKVRPWPSLQNSQWPNPCFQIQRIRKD